MLALALAGASCTNTSTAEPDGVLGGSVKQAAAAASANTNASKPSVAITTTTSISSSTSSSGSPSDGSEGSQVVLPSAGASSGGVSAGLRRRNGFKKWLRTLFTPKRSRFSRL